MLMRFARGVNQWLKNLPPLLAATVVALVVFVILTLAFAAGASSFSAAATGAAVYACLAAVASLLGRSLGVQRQRHRGER